MARKNKNGLRIVFDLAAALPWWLGVALAVASYVILHHVAGGPFPAYTIRSPDQFASTLVQSIVHAAASIFQYLIPGALLAGAIASAFARRKRRTLLAFVAGGHTASRLRQLSWLEFEMLVGEHFRRRGFSVVETGGNGADGGVDLQLRKGGELFVVQCKHWKATKVPVHVVRDLYGVMAACGAAGGFVVATGRFTSDAERWARGKGIELVDGRALSARISKRPIAGAK
ncbi:restriction endonuclease [Cupriavidus basilensis]|jgi:restriction system protein|uniref:restriction endonuclease n=1 Tax=Cupriavidus basilensis TaxID=68895 RepID=UPI0023E85B86|nr:restriction endonuclease [Cupriavidus basilensis]MDF3885011.1 restriction endonuclease [Cupriavidus basilensis]